MSLATLTLYTLTSECLIQGNNVRRNWILVTLRSQRVKVAFSLFLSQTYVQCFPDGPLSFLESLYSEANEKGRKGTQTIDYRLVTIDAQSAYELRSRFPHVKRQTQTMLL